MRYTKFIALLATMFVAVSCVTNDLDFDDSYTDTASDVVTVYGNIARFADCEVSTRANKTPEESYVSRMALAVFPIDDGETGDCIHYELRDGSNLLYTVDRAEIRENYPDGSGGCDYDNQPCVMYIFANMSGLPTTYTGSAADLLNLALANPGLIRPDDGFPMIGSLGDKDRDGKEFVLIPMSGNRMDLPTVDGTPTDYLNIPMNAIFAKISFEIAVSPDQDIDVHAPARFEMTGYEVHNLPSSVSFNEGNNMEAKQNVNGEPTRVAMSGIAQGGNEGSGSTIDFDFYLPERLLTPQTNPADYDYPLGKNGAIVGYDDIPEGNKKYAQRYKPKLLGEDQKATFVRIKGKYRDHQEHYHDVSYDIYLGADNYGDFNIKRNNQYYNKLNIKGITSSDDQAENPNAISIDWRVNVERSSPLIISLRRETQLDSHYEVRPLRLRIAGDQVPDGAKVTVEVLNADEKDWIRLEASGTDDTYITSGVSAGKRKYFTTDLMGKLSTTVTVADFQPKVNSTVWIYVDEADVSEATTTRTTRSATIRVTYEDNGKYKEEPFVKDYTLNQYNLHEIKTDNNTYYIECFEEYLYNYDAEDSYGQTKQEGMPWGLNDVQLSHEHYSFNSSLTPNVDWAKYETKAKRPYYDFYIWAQDSVVLKSAGIANTEARHDYAGQHFTEEIYDATKGNSNVDKKVNVLTMADQPRGAVEYCYNRNKRNSDGSVVEVKWYLPAADELEDFIVKAYNYYEEFQENYYWTSQPAYIRNVFYYEYQSNRVSSKTISWPTVYDENPKYARASKIVRKDGTLEPVKSGLDSLPTPYVDNRASRDNGKYTNYTNLGYFYVMHQYKRYYKSVISGVTEEYGPDRTGVLTGTNVTNGSYDDQFSHNGSDNYFHLGHLDNLMQDGYHERTKNNRVRCVYKKKAD